MDVWNTERNVVHHTEHVPVSIGGHVQHVFDPVGAVWDLHVHPVCFGVFHAPVPVNMKSQNVFVESVHRRPIMNDEASMNNSPTDLRSGPGRGAGTATLHERDAMILRIVPSNRSLS